MKKIFSIIGVLGILFAFPAFAFTYTPSSPVDCSAFITGYSNADASSVVHSFFVYSNDTEIFTGNLRLSTDGSHEINSAAYVANPGIPCQTPGITYYVIESRLFNDTLCNGLGHAACSGIASAINTASWTVPALAVVPCAHTGGIMTSSSLGCTIQHLNGAVTDSGQAIWAHFFPWAIGTGVIISAWYVGKSVLFGLFL